VASCLVCGGTHAEQRFVQRGYPVFRCTGCDLADAPLAEGSFDAVITHCHAAAE
jgi:hypothetical protein